jgi:hypothetical protein
MALAVHFMQAGRYADAGEPIELSLKQLHALSAADPKNVKLQTDIFLTVAAATEIDYRQADHGKAIKRARDGLARFAALPNEVRGVREVRSSLADTKSYLGLALLAANDKPGAPIPALKEACAQLADGLAFLEEWRASQQGAINETEFKERRDGFTHCQARMAQSATP